MLLLDVFQNVSNSTFEPFSTAGDGPEKIEEVFVPFTTVVPLFAATSVLQCRESAGRLSVRELISVDERTLSKMKNYEIPDSGRRNRLMMITIGIFLVTVAIFLIVYCSLEVLSNPIFVRLLLTCLSWQIVIKEKYDEFRFEIRLKLTKSNCGENERYQLDRKMLLHTLRNVFSSSKTRQHLNTMMVVWCRLVRKCNCKCMDDAKDCLSLLKHGRK